MIGIVDYGMGNLHSVSKALERIGLDYVLSNEPSELAQADGLILPGVGAFPDAMTILDSSGLRTFLDQWVGENKPLLGICLGMQLLFEESEEYGWTKGLGYLPGKVVRFSGKTREGVRYKVPHMGWNNLTFHKKHPLLETVEEGYVYFVHSYVVQTEKNVVLASSEYHHDVPAIVGRENVLGAQFHPEKSSDVGMAILRQFGKLVEQGVKIHD
ncbi:imidazole glycerol phosphate synthase subunit HisH [Shouchella shacheensis]|uniref:imidazole glycerol phosphate synthase subunit HisH n=1 Tax=Shouchella shacheensis TaxID=1649580 RepID=UPI0007403EEF|nr:imidazole glycerol phosphate synthase subunit HisH [Shouchella shacheensis]